MVSDTPSGAANAEAAVARRAKQRDEATREAVIGNGAGEGGSL
jgi:hypothetical protein